MPAGFSQPARAQTRIWIFYENQNCYGQSQGLFVGTEHLYRSESSLNSLADNRDPLTSTDACRCQAIPTPSTPQFMQHRQHQTSPCGTERMTQRNRPTVHVGDLAIQTQFLFDRK